MPLQPLNSIERIQQFATIHRLSDQLDDIADLANSDRKFTTEMSEVNAVAVLVFALREYFPRAEYANRIKVLLHNAEGMGHKLPLCGLSEVLPFNKFAGAMSSVYMGTVNEKQVLERYSSLDEAYAALFQSIGDRSIEELWYLIHELKKGLDESQYFGMVKILEARYPKLLQSRKRLKKLQETGDADAALLIYEVTQSNRRVDQIDVAHLSRDGVARALRSLESTGFAQGQTYKGDGPSTIAIEMRGRQALDKDQSDIESIVKKVLESRLRRGTEISFPRTRFLFALYETAIRRLAEDHDLIVKISSDSARGGSKLRLKIVEGPVG